jgi:hypothetical protein
MKIVSAKVPVSRTDGALEDTEAISLACCSALQVANRALPRTVGRTLRKSLRFRTSIPLGMLALLLSLGLGSP